jgi:hypothetical protein
MNIPTQDNPYLRLLGRPTEFYGGSRTTLRLVLEEVNQISPRSVELTGFPGQGKSSLLQYLADPSGVLSLDEYSVYRSHLFPLYVPCRNISPSSHPFVHFWERFRDEYCKFRDRYHVENARWLPEISPEHSTIPASAAQAVDWLEADLRQIVSAEIRPVLLFDDFDIAFERLTRDQATRLRPLRDIVSFILVTERPLQKVNPIAAGSVFFQILLHIHFHGLTRAEAAYLLSQPAANTGAAFPDSDIAFLLAQAGYFPYLLILAGAALWETRKKLVKLEHITTAMSLPGEHRLVLQGHMREEFAGTFHVYWEMLSSDERHAIEKLVKGEPFHRWPEREQAALAPLEQKGLIKLEKSGYEVFSLLFSDYVQEVLHAAQGPARVLSGMEGKVYEYLKRNPDRVCTFEELARDVWETSLDVEEKDRRKVIRGMHVTISRLKGRLKEEDIVSVRKQGYRLVPFKRSKSK